VIVVTRRRAAVAESRALAARIAARWPGAVVATVQLALDGLAGLRSGRRVDLSALAKKRVIVAAGIADPVSFAAQVRAFGPACNSRHIKIITPILRAMSPGSRGPQKTPIML